MSLTLSFGPSVSRSCRLWTKCKHATNCCASCARGLVGSRPQGDAAVAVAIPGQLRLAAVLTDRPLCAGWNAINCEVTTKQFRAAHGLLFGG